MIKPQFRGVPWYKLPGLKVELDSSLRKGVIGWNIPLLLFGISRLSSEMRES